MGFFDYTAFTGRYGAYAPGGSNPTFNAGWIDNPSDPNGPDNSIGYDGYVFDLAGATESTSTGLYMVRHRVYDPGLGRWMQRDPMVYVDGMSQYMYGMAHPVLHADPTGLSSADCASFFPGPSNGRSRQQRMNSGQSAHFWAECEARKRNLSRCVTDKLKICAISPHDDIDDAVLGVPKTPNHCLLKVYEYRVACGELQRVPSYEETFRNVLPGCFNDCPSLCMQCMLALILTGTGCSAGGPVGVVACLSGLGVSLPTVCLACWNCI